MKISGVKESASVAAHKWETAIESQEDVLQSVKKNSDDGDVSDDFSDHNLCVSPSEQKKNNSGRDRQVNKLEKKGIKHKSD